MLPCCDLCWNYYLELLLELLLGIIAWNYNWDYGLELLLELLIGIIDWNYCGNYCGNYCWTDCHMLWLVNPNNLFPNFVLGSRMRFYAYWKKVA